MHTRFRISNVLGSLNLFQARMIKIIKKKKHDYPLTHFITGESVYAVILIILPFTFFLNFPLVCTNLS